RGRLAAVPIAVLAPMSSLVVRAIGARLTVTAGLLLIAGGLGQIATASAATTYGGILPGILLLGVGAGLVVPAATALVMGSVPAEHTGAGAATNATVLPIGGALGVAVIGSLLSGRYPNR